MISVTESGRENDATYNHAVEPSQSYHEGKTKDSYAMSQ